MQLALVAVDQASQRSYNQIKNHLMQKMSSINNRAHFFCKYTSLRIVKESLHL